MRAALVSLGLTLVAGCWTPLKADQQNLDQRDPAAKEKRADALVAKLQQRRARVDASSRKVSLQEAIELSNGAPSVGFSANTYFQRVYNAQRELVKSSPGSALN